MRTLALVLVGLALSGCGDPPPTEGDNPAASAGRTASPEQMKGRSMADVQAGRGAKGR